MGKKIKNKEYQRLPESTKNKLILKQETNVSDFIKDPIVIKNTVNKEIIKEKALQELILNNIQDFLKQLGDGFAFIDNEYKIRIKDTYNYIDILLYNINYSCYVVVELKVTELKKEHLGQIQVYMNYIDETLKKENQNKTIGIIIYKEGNNYLLHYCTDKDIFATKYITI